MEPGQSFLSLYRFVREKIDKYQLMDSDPLISRVQIDSKHLAQSYVYIEFQNKEKFLNSLGISDDDVWFALALDSPYSNVEFIDDYSAKEDFSEGYGLWHELDEDNYELLKKISIFFYMQESDLYDEDYKQKLAEKLMDNYPHEINDIVRDYVIEKNNEMNQYAKTHIDNEINNYLSEFSIELVSYETIKIKIGDLISLYYQYDLTHLPIKKMLKEVFESQESNLGGWDDNRWEYRNHEYFDGLGFNREVYKNLDKIYDDLLEKNDDLNSKDFFEVVKKISNKFKVGVWNLLPKDPKFSFKIVQFNRDESKIVILFKKNNQNPKQISLSEPNFYNLLYHPDLFDLEDL